MLGWNPVHEFIDPVFAKPSSKQSFAVIENERFGLVFYKFGHRAVATSALAA
jgi:hypothetical protein